MLPGTYEKTTALLLTIVMNSMAVAGGGQQAGMYAGCSLVDRMSYPFLHANILHAITNAWCLLVLVFHYNVSWRAMLVAYIIAVAVPNFLLTTQHVVGFSGVCFALMGSISFRVKRKLYWQAWMAAFMLLGFVFPHAVAAWVHLYCYVTAVVIAALNTPLATMKGGWR